MCLFIGNFKCVLIVDKKKIIFDYLVEKGKFSESYNVVLRYKNRCDFWWCVDELAISKPLEMACLLGFYHPRVGSIFVKCLFSEICIFLDRCYVHLNEKQ